MKRVSNHLWLLFFCLGLCLSFSAYAQQTVHLAGKKYVIPAFEQTILKTKAWDFEGVKPIEQSKNKLEVRFSFFAGIGKAMIAIKANRNSLWADCYYYMYSASLKPDPRFPVERFTDKNGHPMSMVSKRIELTASADSVIRLLVKNELFTLKDEDVVLDSLRKNNIAFKNNPWLDGSWGTDFIIKLNDQYRRFNIIPETDAQNPSMEVFAKRARLFNLFHGLFRSSGLPSPVW